MQEVTGDTNGDNVLALRLLEDTARLHGNVLSLSVATDTALQNSATLQCTLQNTCSQTAQILAAGPSINKVELLPHPCPGLLSGWEMLDADFLLESTI